MNAHINDDYTIDHPLHNTGVVTEAYHHDLEDPTSSTDRQEFGLHADTDDYVVM